MRLYYYSVELCYIEGLGPTGHSDLHPQYYNHSCMIAVCVTQRYIV